MCIGYITAASLGQSYLNWQQRGGEIQQDVILEGRIDRYQSHTEFDRLIISEISVNNEIWPADWQIQLNYYRPQKHFQRGQRIVASARIKPARALANPYGFDVQKWYVSQQIIKTGYIRQHDIRLIAPVLSVRHRLQEKVGSLDLPGKKWLKALLFGDRTEFTDTDWQILQRTGSAHVFAISGLHLMIVAGFAMLITKGLTISSAVSGSRQPDSVYALSVGVAIICCGFYAYLADWQIAVLRAYSVIVVLAVLYCIKRRVSRIWVLIITLLISVLVNPYAVYGTGLYLSVGAVAAILACHWLWHSPVIRKPWRLLLILQGGLTLLMLPLVAGVFGQFSIIAPLVNIILIPLISMVIVPGCMTGLALLLITGNSDISYGVLWLTGTGLNLTMHALTLFDNWCAHWSVVALPDSDIVLTIAVMQLIVLIPGLRYRRLLLLLCCLTLSSWWLERLRLRDNWQVHVLDVGQGNATVVSQDDRALLIDTGAGHPGGSNYVDSVLIPFLNANGYTLESVFISHFDNDHAGGLPALKRHFPEVPVLSPESGCVQGRHFDWHSLNVRIIWPPQQALAQLSDNNGSCVLVISDEHHQVWLPGDIEQSAERLLVANAVLANTKQTSVLLAAHHGSKTSSSDEFIRAIAPDVVVYSQGWLNRWGFPHYTVRQRFQRHQVKELLISQTGYVRFDFGEAVKMTTYRTSNLSKWFHKPF